MIPTMRERRRYVRVRFECEVTEREAREGINSALLSFLGVHGFSKANPKFLEFRDGEAVFLCSHSEVQKVKAALALVSRLNGRECCIRVVRVSGVREKV